MPPTAASISGPHRAANKERSGRDRSKSGRRPARGSRRIERAFPARGHWPAGAGKSTLARALAAAVGEGRGAGLALVAALDGFDLSNETLELLGLRSVKGAPQTFDAATFMALLRRLREEPAAVLWPDFDRLPEATIPEAILIGPELVARTRRLAESAILL